MNFQHTRHSSSAALFDRLEDRRLFALIGPDLLGAGINLSSRYPVASSGEIEVNFAVHNNGGLFGNAGAFWVTFWRTDQHPHDEYINMTRVGDVRVDKLDSGKYFHGTLNIPASSLTSGIGNDNEGFLMMEIDSTRAQGEWNEGNNFRHAENKDFIAYSIEGDLDRHPAAGKPTKGRWLPVNTSASGFIGDEGIGSRDFDIFDMPTSAGQRYKIDIDRVAGSNLDSFVRVYDWNWNLVAQNDNGRDENEAADIDAYVEFTSTASQVYRIVVSNNFNQTGDPRTLEGRYYSNSFRATGGYTVSAHAISARPIVNLSVLDGVATEGNADYAVIRVHRSGSPDAALSVSWQLLGTAQYDIDYTLNGGNASGGSVVIPAGMQYVDVQVRGIDDGIWEPDETIRVFVQSGNSYYIGVGGGVDVTLRNAIVDLPRVLNYTDIFIDNYGQRVWFKFDESVGHSLDVTDFVLVNTTTGTQVSSSKLSVWFDEGSNSATVRFPGFDRGVLPDGNYRITLNGAGVSNLGGQTMAGSVQHTFFALAGDLNRDRQVDFSDLLILAQNYGNAGRSLLEGNASGDLDGKVDFDDLLILAQNYGKSAVIQSPLFADGPIKGSTKATERRAKTEPAILI